MEVKYFRDFNFYLSPVDFQHKLLTNQDAIALRTHNVS